MSQNEIEVGWVTAVLTYWSFTLLIIIGHFRDFLRKLVTKSRKTAEGYAPILREFEDFYTRRLYGRVSDCWNRPVTSCPGAWLDVSMRDKSDNVSQPWKETGETRRCFNLGSYNYLGFGDPDSPTRPKVLEALHKFSVHTTSARMDAGTTTLHRDCEKLVARFIGKEDAMIVGMGFGTNSTVIPAIVGKGGLIISDAANHTSIVVGARSSGAKIKVFKHNDVKDLEAIIRQSIVEGQPRTHRPWTKILVMVEGIYSMEGEMCPLPEVVAVCKKYNVYLYVDEAHSIGAIGHTGRGICEQTGVNPNDVDVLMGTFTKSFGAVGGYIAANKELIKFLRNTCSSSLYSSSINPPAVQQVISSMSIIAGEDGTNLGRKKLDSLRDNSNYFRKRLMEKGCSLLGHWDSPVVPMMICHPNRVIYFSRKCLEKKLAVVVVGFPATKLLEGRARFCISAAHTREDLDWALEELDEIVGLCNIRYKDRIPEGVVQIPERKIHQAAVHEVRDETTVAA